MEQEYGIGVTNRYALFLEESSHEEDPLEIIKNAEVEKAKKKTKAAIGEAKENKGKLETKGKSTSGPTRKGQGIKETQNVKPSEISIGNKLKVQDGPVKSLKTPGGRKENDRTSGPLGQDRSVKFASGPGDNAQNERASNRRNRDDKGQDFQQRNGVGPRRNFRDGEGRKDDGFRSARNDGDMPRGPRREGDRPFRNDRNVERQASDAENRPPRREFRERRDFQDREPGGENGEARSERRSSGAPAKIRGNRQGGAPPGTRGFDNRGKREFERKSGSDKTGVKAVDKREGGGAHNWGTHKDDMDTVSHGLNTTTLSDDLTEWPEQKAFESEVASGDIKEETNNATDTEPAPPAEEEPKELTLDEWRALHGKRELPQFNLRKAGEGEDLTQWKDMYEIKKKRDSEEHDDEEEFDATEYPQRVGRQRHVLDIDITFSDSRRGPRGPRGGRTPRPAGMNAAPGSGRPRPREGPRRGPRDEKIDSFGSGRERDFNARGPRQSAPKVDDEHDFPSLG